MDWLTMIREGVLPEESIRVPRKENRVEEFP
jgi:hypothetical protein